MAEKGRRGKGGEAAVELPPQKEIGGEELLQKGSGGEIGETLCVSPFFAFGVVCFTNRTAAFFNQNIKIGRAFALPTTFTCIKPLYHF